MIHLTVQQIKLSQISISINKIHPCSGTSCI